MSAERIAGLRLVLRGAAQLRSRRLRAEHVARARQILDALDGAPADVVRVVEQLEAEVAQAELPRMGTP